MHTCDTDRRINDLVSENEIYLHGRCHILAIALARAIEKPLAATFDWDPDVEMDCLVHAYVLDDEGWLIDLAGLREIDDALSEFPVFDASEVVVLSESELLQFGEGSPQRTSRIERELRQLDQLVDEILECVVQQRQSLGKALLT